MVLQQEALVLPRMVLLQHQVQLAKVLLEVGAGCAAGGSANDGCADVSVAVAGVEIEGSEASLWLILLSMTREK